MSKITLPLFPLSAQVFPGGRLALRIFEPRYLRMMREAAALLPSGETRGFGICMVAESGENQGAVCAIGTRVQLADFDALEDDQILVITVEGQCRFRLDKVWQDETDRLHWAECELLENWPEQILLPEHSALADELASLYRQHPILAELITAPQWHRADWLVLRWLELLPLSSLDKQLLLDADDCQPALEFLTEYLSPESDAPASSPQTLA